MVRGGRDEWENDVQVYTSSQVEGVLERCDVEIAGETNNDFQCYCPYHGNRDTPAFNVSKRRGSFICFNPTCGVSGTLVELIRYQKKVNIFQAERIIIKARNDDSETLQDRIKENLEKPVDFQEWEYADKLPKMKEALWNTPHALEYMHSRQFEDDTLDYFDVGYSNAKGKNMVVVPMHDPVGLPIGIIGRSASHIDKRFKNSTGLPKSQTVFNLHRARRHGERIVLVEASFCAMRVHQAGYPNVGALLGGHITDRQAYYLKRYFTEIIIMTDFEPDKRYNHLCRACNNACRGHRAGRDLGHKIANLMRGKRVSWAAFDDKVVYPNRAKDPGEMTDDEIRQCLKNSVSNYEYQSWGIDQ